MTESASVSDKSPRAGSQDNLVELERVGKTYVRGSEQIHVLENLSLTIP